MFALLLSSNVFDGHYFHIETIGNQIKSSQSPWVVFSNHVTADFCILYNNLKYFVKFVGGLGGNCLKSVGAIRGNCNRTSGPYVSFKCFQILGDWDASLPTPGAEQPKTLHIRGQLLGPGIWLKPLISYPRPRAVSFTREPV